MTAETAREFARLEAQAQRLMEVFTHARYEAVAPAVIQPSGVFLDAVGETLRARTYVFTDHGGAELCLRPDLTVPICRLHLGRLADAANQRSARAPADGPARYCYNGAAFRYQPAGADEAHPREFRQAGIEQFGAMDANAAEAEVLELIIAALATGGLDRRALTMQFGDLSLIAAVLDALDMPPTWRARLKARFGRPAAFKAELMRLSEGGARSQLKLPPALVSELEGATGGGLVARVGAHLDAHGFEISGSRSVADVAEGLAAMLEDARAAPLRPEIAAVINSYIAIRGPCREAVAQIAALARSGGIDLAAPLARFQSRLDAFTECGIDLDDATFSGGFGRSLAYYTGFVFEIVSPGLGHNSPLAGGGRYDGLMRIAGSSVDIPAVGAAIHTERLLAATAQVRA